jgi:hypothetical protein
MMNYKKISIPFGYQWKKWIHPIACLFIGMAIHAQVVFTDIPPVEHAQTLQALITQVEVVNESLQKDGFNCSRFDILEIGQQKYLLPDGHMQVYEWQKTHWQLLNPEVRCGYNFSAKKFVYNNALHSYGGYGFWRSHGDIIRFDRHSRKWEILPFTKVLKGGVASFTGTGLYVYGQQSYYVDLAKENVFTIRQYLAPFSKEDSFNAFTLEVDGYTLNNEKRVLIDAKANTLYSTEMALFLLEKAEFMHNKYALHIAGPNITLYDHALTEVRKFAVPETTKETAVVYAQNGSSNSLLFLSFGAVFTLISIFIWQIAARKKKQKQLTPKHATPSHSNTMNALLSYDKKLLSADELDAILKLSNITSPDTLRYKRAQVIKELNQLYVANANQPLIVRKPDPADGRKYVYEIMKST